MSKERCVDLQELAKPIQAWILENGYGMNEYVAIDLDVAEVGQVTLSAPAEKVEG
ncbi:hypothetical protein PODOV026v1_p0042 [Vibrio phage PS32B.1]|nr:hypothetical protein PODOV026v1_p0042 [Vibrio phage PS32B.1]